MAWQITSLLPFEFRLVNYSVALSIRGRHILRQAGGDIGAGRGVIPRGLLNPRQSASVPVKLTPAIVNGLSARRRSIFLRHGA
jgi:hypothetical protein